MRTRVRLHPSQTRVRLHEDFTVLEAVDLSATGLQIVTELGAPVLATTPDLVAIGVEVLTQTGVPSLGTSAGVITLPAAIGVEAAVNLGEPPLTQVHALVASGASSTTEVGSPALTEGGAPITFSAAYAAGGGGSGPILNITNLVLGDTTGPYDIFIATHANSTTLSKDDIENSTGATEDALTFQDADGVVIGQELVLSTTLTGGHLSLFIRDSLGDESGIVQLDNVDVDASAPVLSSPTATATGPNSATWGVTSNEATGTVHAGARPSGDSPAFRRRTDRRHGRSTARLRRRSHHDGGCEQWRHHSTN
jgi:hypothetical protein